MATNTAKMQLIKPDPTDTVDITQLNSNNQKVDDTLPNVSCTSVTRPPVPFVGMEILETDTGKYYVWAGGTWKQLLMENPAGIAINSDIAPTNLQGYKNAIINGSCQIRQRGGTANIVASIAQYGLDQWVMMTGVGSAISHTAMEPIAAGVPAPLSQDSAVVQIVNTTTNNAGDYAVTQFRLEDARLFQGQKVTFSFWAKASAGTPSIAIEIEQNFGTGGSPTAPIDTFIQKVVLSAVWARYTVTFTVPSVAGKTFGTNGDHSLRVNIWQSAGTNFSARTGALGTQAVTIQFFGIQLELGGIATPLETRPKGIELALCQRYYYRMSADGIDTFKCFGIGSSVTSVIVVVLIFFKAVMRAKPTFSSGGAFRIRGSAAIAVASFSGPSSQAASTDLVELVVNTAGGLGVNQALTLEANSDVNAYLDFSAEL